MPETCQALSENKVDDSRPEAEFYNMTYLYRYQ